jgi:hypothetical protein
VRSSGWKSSLEVILDEEPVVRSGDALATTGTATVTTTSIGLTPRTPGLRQPPVPPSGNLQVQLHPHPFLLQQHML